MICMRLSGCFVIFAISITGCLAESWTTTDGKRFEADLVACKNGMVIFKSQSGSKQLMQLEKLSAESQNLVLEKFPHGKARETVKTVSTEKPAAADNKPPARAYQKDPATKRSVQTMPAHPGLAKLKKGDAPPPLSGKIQGSANRVSVNDLRGQFVLVIFWSSQHVESVNEARRYARVYPQLKKLGIEVIGVSNESSHARLEDLEEAYGITWPVALDPRMDIIEMWGVTALPTAVLLDPSGRVAEEHVWSSDLNQVLGKYLKAR